MNLFLFISVIFLSTFLLGILLKKIRVPWIFASLILGLILSFHNSFQILTSSETFKFLAWLGMYFLLFLIGFELNLEKIKKLGKFIIKSTFFIILFEALFGSLLIHFIFNYSWFISIITALSFATVGEAVLIPILDEFKLTKTKLGQTILGIGTLDDVIEIFIIIMSVLAVPILLGQNKFNIIETKILSIFLSIFILFFLSFEIIKLKKKIPWTKIDKLGSIFILTLAIFFLFTGFAQLTEMMAVGALLAGISVRNFLPKEKIYTIESKIKTLTYTFFGPIFFFWVGVDTDVNYLFKSMFLILLIIIVTYSAKILASWLVANKELGAKTAIFMGISLGVRFSTSIVIIKFLFEKNLIQPELYSVLIASMIAFKFIIPFLLSFLINKWGLKQINNK